MKYALLGYTYQHYIASLLLAMMDVERKFDWIGLEVDAVHKFDDIIVKIGAKTYTMQLKDIERASMTDLSFKSGVVEIKGTPHKLSDGINVLFFKDLKLTANTSVLGFPALKVSGVYVVSMSRTAAEKRISGLYKDDLHRRQLMHQFLALRLDERKLELDRSQLPSLAIFDNRLVERTIMVARKILDFQDILYIEGKPGVGKSHLVSLLEKRFSPCLLYRFWISSQDRDYEQRLKFSSFKSDLSKKLFFDQKERSEEQLLDKLSSGDETLIVDGLDHVENYRPTELPSFIDFFDRAKKCCKIIVLGRPLTHPLSWKKQILGNWNFVQTKRVLRELYHIEEYASQQNIYTLSSGYPILVRYLAEQYKKDGTIAEFAALDSVNSYYDQLFAGQHGKSILSIFLCARGYLMHSELGMLLGEFTGIIVKEFIAERPYLFEYKLNRVSLYHDSLNTYLRNSLPDITTLKDGVNAFVFNSLIKGEKRFQSRVIHFDLPTCDVVKLIKYYSSIKNFRSLMAGVIDFEAVQEFYKHLREMLFGLLPEDLEVIDYYELSLILNLVIRDHFSTMNGFYYTYAKVLDLHEFSEEDVTSSGYLFGMQLYLTNQDATHLYNLKSDRHYDTSRFYEELEDELNEELDFFKTLERPYNKKSIDLALSDASDSNFTDNLRLILVNVYLHSDLQRHYPEFFSAMDHFFNGREQVGAMELDLSLEGKFWNYGRCQWLLEGAKAKLLGLGVDPVHNDYLNLSLKDYLFKHGQKGSYQLWPEVLSYIRLSQEKKKIIDIGSISGFFTKYYQRKDYTLYSVDQALTVFEEQGFVEWRDSVELIQYLQEISEKGYRSLLGSYLELHEPSFIIEVLKEFPLKTLVIDWFKLSSKYLEVIPVNIYEYEFVEQLRVHGRSGDIPIEELENLFPTKWMARLKKDLSTTGLTISLEDGDPRFSYLAAQGIAFKVNPPDIRYSNKKTPQERFDQGVLDERNAFLIRDFGLGPAEVAFMADAYNTALADPSLFRVFDNQLLKAQMKIILFNALTARSGYSDSLNVTWLLPGNLLRLFSDSGMPVDFAELFESFKTYLSLSMIEFQTP